MKKYEAMCIIKPDLSEEDQKTVVSQIADIVKKNGATVAEAGVWSEKRRMCFPIKKQHDGVYYLVKMSAPTQSISKMRYAFQLNENILRVLITNREEKK